MRWGTSWISSSRGRLEHGVLEFARGVAAGVGLAWRGHAEMGAEGSPAVAQFMDQQALLRHYRRDGFHIGFIERDGMGAVARLAAEHLVADQGEAEGGGIGALAQAGHDGLFETRPPAFGAAVGENDAGERIGADQLRPVMGRGPIHAGGIACKQLVPAGRRALHEGPPEALLLLVGIHFIHVVARAEAQHVKRLAHGVGARAAETSSDYFECHAAAPEPVFTCDFGHAPVLRHSFRIELNLSTARKTNETVLGKRAVKPTRIWCLMRYFKLSKGFSSAYG